MPFIHIGVMKMEKDEYKEFLIKMEKESHEKYKHYIMRNEVNEHGGHIVPDYCDADLTQWYQSYGQYDAYKNALWEYKFHKMKPIRKKNE